ncbi:MAG: YhbY family RNA-binding protein [Burkholderiales bacterium]
MLTLTPAQRSALRAAAHKLHPVVLIGDHGLTDQIMQEIERNLLAHELIKIRVAGTERDDRAGILAQICERLDAAPVQQIGRILVVFRPNPEQARKPAPRPARRQPRQNKRSFQSKA